MSILTDMCQVSIQFLQARSSTHYVGGLWGERIELFFGDMHSRPLGLILTSAKYFFLVSFSSHRINSVVFRGMLDANCLLRLSSKT